MTDTIFENKKIKQVYDCKHFNKSIKIRKLKNSLFKLIIFTFSFFVFLPLFLIIVYITKKGLSVINIKFLTELPVPVGEIGGGIFNGIIGTLIVIIIASILAIPVGIFAGVFISEYKNTKIAKLVLVAVEILQSIPSIVIGIVAWIWIVLPMKHFSAFAGGVALCFMMLPVIVKSTEETLNLVPHSLKEASYALGVPYHKTILKVIIPAGLNGIITGILMGIARIAGETAPLLFTAFGNPYLNFNIFKPVDTLPLLIFNYATSPYEQWHNLAWGISIVLVFIIFFINFGLRTFISKKRVKL